MKLSSSFSSSSLIGLGVGLVAGHWGCVGVGRRAGEGSSGVGVRKGRKGVLQRSGRAGLGYFGIHLEFQYPKC